jgi:uncharacterized protein (TIGR01777 family)
VLVSGATGLVGSALVATLGAGHEVVRLTRGAARPPGARMAATAGEGATSTPRAPADLHWDPERGVLDRGALEGLDAVVHLAGESIAGRRWNAAHKRRVRESRVTGTRLLCEALAALARPPRVLVSSSAIGYYGDRGDEALGEESPPGAGFLADVAREWEESTAAAERRGIRVVRLRTGIVLAARGGALEPMRRLFLLGCGGPLGSGGQWMSWIALDDLAGAIVHCLAREDVRGPVNAVAPGAVTQLEFARTLGRVLERPAWVPAPRFAVRLALGREMADELLLASQRVVPRRLEASGYAFRFPALEPALRHVLHA